MGPSQQPEGVYPWTSRPIEHANYMIHPQKCRSRWGPNIKITLVGLGKVLRGVSCGEICGCAVRVARLCCGVCANAEHTRVGSRDCRSRISTVYSERRLLLGRTIYKHTGRPVNVPRPHFGSQETQFVLLSAKLVSFVYIPHWQSYSP